MDGILLFDKPILWTSHDAVDFARRRLKQKSVGHAGTLDPLATGLLVLLLGRATKLSAQLTASDKDYSGSMTLGIETDTLDLEGKILSQKDPSSVKEADLLKAFAGLTGAQEQIPPNYSSVKKDGRKLYALARQGVALEVAPRPIRVDRFALNRCELPEAYFSLTCSKGTYVRSLCESVGKKLGCGAVLSALVRTRSGSFNLRDALKEEELRRFDLETIEKKLVVFP